MWDLTGTEFVRGVWELRLEKVPRGLWKIPLGLGPIRGRVIAIVVLLITGYLNYFAAPYANFVGRGWMTPETGKVALTIQTWVLGGLAVALHLSVFFFRRERME